MSTRIFFLLVALLPTQLTLYWFIPSSYVYGLPIDYLAAQFSLTDGILILLLISQIRTVVVSILHHKKNFVLYIGSLILLILFSQYKMLSLLYALKVLELSFLGWYIVKHKVHIAPRIGTVLLIPLLVSAVVATIQFLTGRSLGGPLYFLGERTFSYSTPGIAHITLWGNHLRPYATFPHPNVLAAFAAFVILVNYQYSKKRVAVLSFLIASPILFLTFSKAALLGLGVAVLSLCARRVSAKTLITVVFLISVLSTIAATRILSAHSFPPSIQERLVLMVYSGQMISTSPLFGVGMNGFIPSLPDAKASTPWMYPLSWWLQPVHNIYLLVVSQVGLVGCVILLAVLHVSNRKAYPLLVFFAIVGLFDHYFLTLQQGQLMTAIIIALSFFS